MAVNKTGQKGAALTVNDPRTWPAPGGSIRGAADEDDVAAADGYGFGMGIMRVNGVNPGRGNDQVGELRHRRKLLEARWLRMSRQYNLNLFFWLMRF
jgi:hypothetical protein